MQVLNALLGLASPHSTSTPLRYVAALSSCYLQLLHAWQHQRQQSALTQFLHSNMSPAQQQLAHHYATAHSRARPSSRHSGRVHHASSSGEKGRQLPASIGPQLGFDGTAAAAGTLQQHQQPQGALEHQQQQLGLVVAQPMQISEGDLSELIRAAGSIEDVEQLVLQFHAQFRHYHLAAAVMKLPHLSMSHDLNMQQRFKRLTTLLSSGLLNISHRLDAHQLAGCLAALASPRCIKPLQVGAVQRLLLLLVQQEAAALQQLHSPELADCAAAAAALQEAVRKQGVHTAAAASGNGSRGSSCGSVQHGKQQGLPDRAGSAAVDAAGSLSVYDTLSAAGSSGGTNALALADPLERLWQHLQEIMLPQLPTFSADSLALTGLSLAASGRAGQQVMLGIINAALARPQKFAESPLAVSRMLQALALADTRNQDLLAVLASALTPASTTKALNSKQLAATAAALVKLGFYHEGSLLSICKAAARTLKHWKCDQVVSLTTSLEQLRFRDPPLLAAAVKVLAQAAAEGRMSNDGVADSLAALLQLGFSSDALEGLLKHACSHLYATLQSNDNSSSSSATMLAPTSAVKLLWALAVLEESDDHLQDLLLQRLAGVTAKQLSQHELLLLYQAHRLLTRKWLQAASSGGGGVGAAAAAGGGGGGAEEQGPAAVTAPAAAAAAAGADVGGASAAAGDQDGWPQQLLAAAQSAACMRARSSASRGKQQQRAVQDAFQELGLDLPVGGFAADGGALQPDLAFVAGSSSHGSRDGSRTKAAVPLQVALMCDHAGRLSRNAPHELLGCERVSGWLLEAAGWKVVRLPGHEWKLLVDEGKDAGAALAYVHNALSAHGVL